MLLLSLEVVISIVRLTAIHMPTQAWGVAPAYSQFMPPRKVYARI
jgi:hypothetical protein